MFANSQVTNTYRPDRKLLDAIAALTAQLAILRARGDTIPVSAGTSMGSLGACGLLGMRDGRPSFEVDSGQIELTYSIGARSETLSDSALPLAGCSSVFTTVIPYLAGGWPVGCYNSISLLWPLRTCESSPFWAGLAPAWGI